MPPQASMQLWALSVSPFCHLTDPAPLSTAGARPQPTASPRDCRESQSEWGRDGMQRGVLKFSDSVNHIGGLVFGPGREQANLRQLLGPIRHHECPECDCQGGEEGVLYFYLYLCKIRNVVFSVEA